MEFVNFHHHTTFSFGDGFGTPAQHVERAAELGYSCIAATEHGNVSSHYQLEKAAKKHDIKPIFGLEAYCGGVLEENDEARLVERNGEVVLLPARAQLKNHLTIVAMNAEGYRALNRIVTQSYLDYYYHPTVSGNSLADNSDGIAVLSGCSGSLLACTLLGGKGIPEKNRPDFAAARDVVFRFKSIFEDRYFLEVQPFYELERTKEMNAAYERLSIMTDVPIIVTGDVHYPFPADGEMQAVLHASHRGNNTLEDQMRSWNYEVPMTLPESDNDLWHRLRRTGLSYEAAKRAILNSGELAERCNVTLPKAERLRYPISEQDLRPWT